MAHPPKSDAPSVSETNAPASDRNGGEDLATQSAAAPSASADSTSPASSFETRTATVDMNATAFSVDGAETMESASSSSSETAHPAPSIDAIADPASDRVMKSDAAHLGPAPDASVDLTPTTSEVIASNAGETLAANDETSTDETRVDDVTSELETEDAEAPRPTSFGELGIERPELLEALDNLGWSAPTAVQVRSFASVAESRDVLVQSQTGTGKTGAFCLPWLDRRFERRDATDTGVQLLVLVPTRELAKQVCDQLRSLASGSELALLPLYGGTAIRPQLDALRAGVHAVVGTPGRILDHIRRRTLDLSSVNMVVLDEADEMLSMGFLEDIHAILDACPRDGRQTCLFSATVPPDIERIARRYMRSPDSIKLSGDQVAAAKVTHAYYTVTGTLRTRDLLDVVAQEEPATAIVFCNTREETNLVANVLRRDGYSAEALSSDLNQTARERVLGQMRSGRLRFLVATDVASRGIDISHVSHVINYTFPDNAESYIHRTGRTGRAGRAGVAISLIAPQELGRHYFLKLQYPSLKFEQRYLPSAEELEAQRAETKLDQISSRFPDLVSPEWTLLARNLMTDPRGEQVVAYLLSEAMTNRPVTGSSRDEENPTFGTSDGDAVDEAPPPRPRRRRERSRDRFESDSVDAQSTPSSTGDETPRRSKKKRRRSRRGNTDEDATLAVTEREDAVSPESEEDDTADGSLVEDIATTAFFEAESDAAICTACATEEQPEPSVDEATSTFDIALLSGSDETDDGISIERRRRRRRRRRRKRDESEPSPNATLDDATTTEEEESAAASDSDPISVIEDGDEDGDEPESSRQRRRRRGRRGRARSSSPSTGDLPVAAPPPAPVKPVLAQDQIIIDIDESELEVVRGEFGEINELDDLTLKGRRRGVIDALEEEVELEDMSIRDESGSTDDETSEDSDSDSDEASDDEASDSDDELAASSEDEPSEAEAEAAEDDDAKKKRRRRRRRRKKKPDVLEAPELTAPPHKDFWEVWASKFTYKDFEDDTYQGGIHAQPEPEEIEKPEKPRARRPSMASSASVVAAESSSRPSTTEAFVKVCLSVGRAHGKKSAHIRELLANDFDLSGKLVRDLTVGDELTHFRVSRHHYSRLAEGMLGYVYDDVELVLTRLEPEIVDEPMAPVGPEAEEPQPTAND